MRMIGIILLVLGILALVYQGITYTREKEVLDIGGLKVKTEDKERIPLPPILGAVAVVGGVALIVADKRGRKVL